MEELIESLCGLKSSQWNHLKNAVDKSFAKKASQTKLESQDVSYLKDLFKKYYS